MRNNNANEHLSFLHFDIKNMEMISVLTFQSWNCPYIENEILIITEIKINCSSMWMETGYVIRFCSALILIYELDSKNTKLYYPVNNNIWDQAPLYK